MVNVRQKAGKGRLIDHKIYYLTLVCGKLMTGAKFKSNLHTFKGLVLIHYRLAITPACMEKVLSRALLGPKPPPSDWR